jgi:DNA-binding CsgD family transcriptional regulator
MTVSGAVSPRVQLRIPVALGRELVLTPRQSEILSLVALGMSDKEIAGRLGIAPRTIRTHLERLFHEYGLSSRSAAVAAWLRGKHHRRPADRA